MPLDRAKYGAIQSDPERRCHICGEHILDSDVIGVVRTATHRTREVHWACTRDGVERWLREGRPHRTPLLADRAEGWTWTRDAAPSEVARSPQPADWSHPDARRRSGRAPP